MRNLQQRQRQRRTGVSELAGQSVNAGAGANSIEDDDNGKRKAIMSKFIYMATFVSILLVVLIHSSVVQQDPEEVNNVHAMAGVRTSSHHAAQNEKEIKKKPKKPIGERQINPKEMQTARSQIQSLKEQFYNLYGGSEEAQQMLKRAIQTAAPDTPDEQMRARRHTAHRILRAIYKGSSDSSSENKDNEKSDQYYGTFTFSFGGYSVTVGRGNLFSQSYPFILEKILKPIFQTLHLQLIVRNSAIGGIPSFPYGWCQPNFLGEESDVVSWDYGMNEGNGAEAFEAYLRLSRRMLKKRPMVIMLDRKRQRVDMLKRYVTHHDVFLDSIAVGRENDGGGKSVVNKQRFFDEMEEKDRPMGFQKWDEWGAPKGSPGQSNWHPKYKEHELIGWVMAVHFLDSIDVALNMLEESGGYNHHHESHPDEKKDMVETYESSNEMTLPPPFTKLQQGNEQETVPFLLYGHPNQDDPNQWHMNHVSCRTSFLPNISGHLSSIVVSGVVHDERSNLIPREDEQYEHGWVVDVGKVERETKIKGEKFGGFGYIDMKLALYGTPQSGVLKLWLPHEGGGLSVNEGKDEEKNAKHWFETLVFCEVNEKRGNNECQMTKDVSFTVGGVKVDTDSVVQITDAAAYLKKRICINVQVPKDAHVTRRKDVSGNVVEGFGVGGDNNADGGGGGILDGQNEDIGLSVDVTVVGDQVSRKNGACSISHVIWQSI